LGRVSPAGMPPRMVQGLEREEGERERKREREREREEERKTESKRERERETFCHHTDKPPEKRS